MEPHMESKVRFGDEVVSKVRFNNSVDDVKMPSKVKFKHKLNLKIKQTNTDDPSQGLKSKVIFLGK